MTADVPPFAGLDAGWFADWDDEQTDYGWQPCFETGQGHIPCFQVWFKTKAECEEWIAANVIGAGWFPGDPTEARVTPPEICTCECSPPEFGGNLPDRDCPIHSRPTPPGGPADA